MNVGNPLDHMVQVLRDYGWTRLQSGSIETGHCLLGAWKHSYRFGPFSSENMLDALRALRDVCDEQYGTGLVVEVNDRHIDDIDQAIALCEKSSMLYAERHG